MYEIIFLVMKLFESTFFGSNSNKKQLIIISRWKWYNSKQYYLVNLGRCKKVQLNTYLIGADPFKRVFFQQKQFWSFCMLFWLFYIIKVLAGWDSNWGDRLPVVSTIRRLLTESCQIGIPLKGPKLWVWVQKIKINNRETCKATDCFNLRLR